MLIAEASMLLNSQGFLSTHDRLINSLINVNVTPFTLSFQLGLRVGKGHCLEDLLLLRSD